ncbi:hypothetical protein T4B_2989 [Trichinella pseudospiralis]|uniref:Uncharacterized protein n=2 Tax=Trichinella pseudospiralis TaxID=6337 RepID=A0A0V1GTT2_TRIPS|nr:hypothetical protein T4B_2989 [Trichinella pseudospiralis]
MCNHQQVSSSSAILWVVLNLPSFFLQPSKTTSLLRCKIQNNAARKLRVKDVIHQKDEEKSPKSKQRVSSSSTILWVVRNLRSLFLKPPETTSLLRCNIQNNAARKQLLAMDGVSVLSLLTNRRDEFVMVFDEQGFNAVIQTSFVLTTVIRQKYYVNNYTVD